MESQSEMLGSRKFNSDTLHQDSICYAAKNKHIRLIKNVIFFHKFLYLNIVLEQILKLLLFICILFAKEINYLWENIYFYIFILYLIFGRKKNLDDKKGS